MPEFGAIPHIGFREHVERSIAIFSAKELISVKCCPMQTARLPVGPFWLASIPERPTVPKQTNYELKEEEKSKFIWLYLTRVEGMK
jgi:hypothetical protein